MQQLTFDGFQPPNIKGIRKETPAGEPKYRSNVLFEPFVQCISVSPSYFTVFNDLSSIRRKKKPNTAASQYINRLLYTEQQNTVTRIINTGTLSRGAQSKMKRAIEYLGIISRDKRVYHQLKDYTYTFKQSFITLTLSGKQRHTDNWIKQNMLKNFIDALRKRYRSLSYVWRAEVQLNGNIHFHIITDHFVPVKYINYLWNRIQDKNGYLDAYYNKHNHLNAPSAEIRKVRKDADLSKYMRKYMIKGLGKHTAAEIKEQINSCINLIACTDSPAEQQRLGNKIKGLKKLLIEADKRKVQGKLWGCSDNLLLKPYTCEIDSLSVDDRQFLFENEVLVTEPYFQVFKLHGLKSFFQRLSSYAAQNMREYFMKLFQPIPIPNIQYTTDMNYSY